MLSDSKKREYQPVVNVGVHRCSPVAPHNKVCVFLPDRYMLLFGLPTHVEAFERNLHSTIIHDTPSSMFQEHQLSPPASGACTAAASATAHANCAAHPESLDRNTPDVPIRGENPARWKSSSVAEFVPHDDALRLFRSRSAPAPAPGRYSG